MTTLDRVKEWPHAAIIDSIQLRIVDVYERKEHADGKYGPWTVQNAMAEDMAGNKIKLGVFDHPDISPMKGKDVVISSVAGRGGKVGGVKVNHNTYGGKTAVEIKIEKSGNFQFVEVYKAHNPQAATETAPESTPASNVVDFPSGATNGRNSQIRSIHGATVGMAINKTCDDLISRGLELTEESVWAGASVLVRVAQKMESGELHVPEKVDEDKVPF